MVVNELLCQQTEEVQPGSNTDTGAPCRAGFWVWLSTSYCSAKLGLSSSAQRC